VPAPVALTQHHVRSAGLTNIGAAVRLALTLDFSDGDHHVIPRFAPDHDLLATTVNRVRELTSHRKVYIHPETGAVSLNADGDLDLAGMLASEGLGTIAKG
jgi:hypothetical protein